VPDDTKRDDAPGDAGAVPATPVGLPAKPLVAVEVTDVGGSAREDVPRLPRGRGFKLSLGELIKIAMLGTLLVAVLVLQKPCADSVAKLVTSFGSDGSGSGSAGGSATMPKPGTVDLPGTGSGYVRLTPDMTPEQVKAAIDQARGKAGSAAGSATGTAGSATPPQP